LNPNSYNSIAPFYDRLSQLIFGKTIVNAQLHLLTAIPAGAHILIAGGGTGWILEEITQKHTSGLTITYVEAAPRMVALARKRHTGGNKVTFITLPIESTGIDKAYDVIITPFLFDNFTDTDLARAFRVLNNYLKPEGVWLYSDFQHTPVLWQRALLWVMYRFFRVLCGIYARTLPDTDSLFAGYKYSLMREKTFLGSFIISRIYKKAL
jgi:ubiquinone/menaquinone biosynthesis C-methylase UbiE